MTWIIFPLYFSIIFIFEWPKCPDLWKTGVISLHFQIVMWWDVKAFTLGGYHFITRKLEAGEVADQREKREINVAIYGLTSHPFQRRGLHHVWKVNNRKKLLAHKAVLLPRLASLISYTEATCTSTFLSVPHRRLLCRFSQKYSQLLKFTLLLCENRHVCCSIQMWNYCDFKKTENSFVFIFASTTTTKLKKKLFCQFRQEPPLVDKHSSMFI